MLLKDDKKVSCYTCFHSLELDHIGIKCPQDHSLCSDCSKKFVENILKNTSKALTKMFYMQSWNSSLSFWASS
ncbi:unnamed protein product [Blepharisma stoltei]|uniref:Uncharacterized protein n=1 Tax=Blepharisma stoltei TaxID=1481888 RepID=A0AAU9JIB2_9CILI|nr:unnamed protein product [Blepharisma stoltei]